MITSGGQIAEHRPREVPLRIAGQELVRETAQAVYRAAWQVRRKYRAAVVTPRRVAPHLLSHMGLTRTVRLGAVRGFESHPGE